MKMVWEIPIGLTKVEQTNGQGEAESGGIAIMARVKQVVPYDDSPDGRISALEEAETSF